MNQLKIFLLAITVFLFVIGLAGGFLWVLFYRTWWLMAGAGVALLLAFFGRCCEFAWEQYNKPD